MPGRQGVAPRARVGDALLEFLCRDVHAIHGETDVEQLALRIATRVLHPHAAAVWLLETDQTLRLAAGVDYPVGPNGEPAPLNEALLRRACTEVVHAPQAELGPLPWHGSYLGAPIRRHGVSLGALEVIG